MRKYLKIAVTSEVKALVEEPWETVLLSEKLNGAELACIAFMKNDAEAMKIAEKIKAKARLEIPIVEVDAGAMNQSTAFIKEKAENYEQKNVPGFLLDLVNFADEKQTTFATPGSSQRKVLCDSSGRRRVQELLRGAHALRRHERYRVGAWRHADARRNAA